MSTTGESRVASAPMNYRRGMFFIRLAVEQIRAFDPMSADLIRKEYADPLQLIFDEYLSRIPWEAMDSSARLNESVQQDSGAAEWNKILGRENLPAGPPGFGLKELGLKEAAASSELPIRDPGVEARLPRSAVLPLNSPWEFNAHRGTANAYSQNRSYSHETSFTEAKKRLDGSTGYAKSQQSHAFQDFGPIGSAKPSSVLAARKAREIDPAMDMVSTSYFYEQVIRGRPGLSRLTSSVNAAPETRSNSQESSTTFADSAAAFLVENRFADRFSRKEGTTDEYMSGRSTVAQQPRANTSEYTSAGDSFHTADTHKSYESPSPKRSFVNIFRQQNAPALHLQEEQQATEKPASQPSQSSWAKVAAISKESSATVSPDGNPHITFTLALPATRMPTAKAASRVPIEPVSDQMRVVWLANLPPKYRSRDVSAQIIEGPVMSILLQTNAHETLPGLSACIIFMSAEHAAQFLANNNYSAAHGKQRGATKYAKDAIRAAAAASSDKASTDKPYTATDVTMIPGAPYPADSAIALMAHPTCARRRVKWSRARLFYDVSLRAFKQDVLALVGSAANIELIHFYNPGEATAIFSSVAVASACVDGFAAWAREHKSASAVTTLEEEGRGGGLRAGRLDGKRGRYEGVEVGYVRDFNEAPPDALLSQYGRDGKLKPSSRAEGCEGLFEGPDVTG